MSTSRDLKVSCSCGAATHTFDVPSTKLPLTSHLCSCDTSRRISGSLLTSYINITHRQSAPKPDLTALTPYHSSERLIRHFCSTCGTHMYLEYHNDGHFEAATGTLQVDSTEGILVYESCMWIEDTKDGGASDWLTHMKNKVLQKWTQEANESSQVSLYHYIPSLDKIEPTRTPVHAHCHCHGVEFWIQPPTPPSKSARSNFPDLIVPYTHGADAALNPSDTTWWLRDNDSRFLAGTCMCNSCRRASGFDVTVWAFVPTANIFQDPGCLTPFPDYGVAHSNEYWGTMETYRSSEGVTRTFCGKCGANVFWDGGRKKGREGLIDVAVGLLDAESGARAEEVLRWWTERVSFAECAVNERLAKALGEGLKDWQAR